MTNNVASRGSANSNTKTSKTEKRQPGFSDANLPVYIVHSRMAIEEIRSRLLDLKAGKVFSIRIEYDSQGHETSRAVVVAEPSVYEAAIEAGLGTRSRKLDFAITPYELREHNKPKKGYQHCFFFRFPDSFSLSAEDARFQLESKLELLTDLGLLEEGTYGVNIPLVSRETGAPKGVAFVKFSPDAKEEHVQLAKVALDFGRWLAGDEYDSWEEMRCFWARDQREFNKNKRDVKTKTEKVPEVETQTTGPVVRTFSGGKVKETTFIPAPQTKKVSAEPSVTETN